LHRLPDKVYKFVVQAAAAGEHSPAGRGADDHGTVHSKWFVDRAMAARPSTGDPFGALALHGAHSLQYTEAKQSTTMIRAG